MKSFFASFLLLVSAIGFGQSEVNESQIPGCNHPLACNYDLEADFYLPGSCEFTSCFNFIFTGLCENEAACNYLEDGECEFESCYVFGCANPGACNYDPTAEINDGSCEYLTCIGCTNPNACDFDPEATIAGQCSDFTSCVGCLDETADNYDASATIEGECIFLGCTVVGACNYDASANSNDGTCDYFSCVGCQNPEACNFDPEALYPGSCAFPQAGFDCDGNCFDSDGDSVCDNDEVDGCTDATALNYDENATEDDGSCIVIKEGCIDILACNYDSIANTDDGSCEYNSCSGCTELGACNFNPNAVLNDGSCVLLDAVGICGGDCTSDVNQNGICDLEELEHATTGGMCGPGTVWDEASQLCLPLVNPSDLNLDGCVDVQDFMGHLAAFGEGCNGNPQTSLWQCGDALEYQGYDYVTVMIGEQCWFAENLRNENYENGDVISTGLSDSDWLDTDSGAVAVYGEEGGCDNFSPDIDACDPTQSLNEYGRLYNWFAVDDARGLCPSGWHVPTDEEWMTMEMALGMSDEEANEMSFRGTDQGTQMKTVYGWSGAGNGTNSSGFSGLPGGYRSALGAFVNAGQYAFWWSSSLSGTSAYYRSIYDNFENVNRFLSDPRGGFSVRCVQDAE